MPERSSSTPEEHARDTRERQQLPATVIDPVALAAVAAIVRATQPAPTDETE